MRLITNPLGTSVAQQPGAPGAGLDAKLIFSGLSGTYYVEAWSDGSYYVLRDGGPAREGVVARLLDADSAALIASQKARALY